MASSGNFCTWNPLNCSSSLKFNTGNLSTDQDTNNWMTTNIVNALFINKNYQTAFEELQKIDLDFNNNEVEELKFISLDNMKDLIQNNSEFFIGSNKSYYKCVMEAINTSI